METPNTNPQSDQNLNQLFTQCDLDGSGFIDQSELAQICSDLSNEQVADVFNEFDKDGDGRISVAEFAAGFQGISQSLLHASQDKRRRRESVAGVPENGADEIHRSDELAGVLDAGLQGLSCQEQVCELYQRLHEIESPALVEHFEEVLLKVLKDVRQYQVDNQRMENTYKREKEYYEHQLRQLEEEVDLQVQRAEERAKSKISQLAEQEKETLRQELESEICGLQDNLKKLQALEIAAGRDPENKEKSSLRVKVDDLLSDNRHLKSELTDAQTHLAVVKSQLTGLKQEYHDRLQQLNTEKQTVEDFIKEQDNLTRQLHVLQNVNKNLHDTNDDLRSALETAHISQKRVSSPDPSESTSNPDHFGMKRGSGIGDYWRQNSDPSSNPSLAEELRARDVAIMHYRRSMILAQQESIDGDSGTGDVDSGLSTLPGHPECESDSDEQPGHPRKSRRYRHRGLRTPRMPSYEKTGEMVDDIYNGMGHDIIIESNDYVRRPGSAASRSSRGSHPRSRDERSMSRDERPMSRDDSMRSQMSLHSQGSVRRMLPMIPVLKPVISTSPTPPKLREPERLFKVVLAGDAAVGKSTLIMRLCKGKFVPNLSSTLGVDFQTKVLDVDGRTVALQLWDTAGQERFRSIAKSYFRRADGVLLLYDCTYERSFINVRDWIEAIEEGSQKKVPIMICGNKTDERDDRVAQGLRVVRTEDGQRLAKDYEALFIETSAKDGDNVTESVIELTRLLWTNEDLEVKSVGLQLQELSSGKPKSGCCK